MMLDEIDRDRFSLCVKTGRRFWTACKAFRFYADINRCYNYKNISWNLHNIDECDVEEESIILSINSDRNVMQFRQNDWNFQEIFQCYGGSFYINAINVKSEYNFRYRYDNVGLLLSEELTSMMAYAMMDFVPLEVNLRGARFESEDGQSFYDRRYPLILLLYKLDSFIDFCSKFTADLMLNPAFHAFLLLCSCPQRRMIGSSLSMESDIFGGCDRIGLDLKKILWK